jgi:uncharacterized protein (TIGR00297 family)
MSVINSQLLIGFIIALGISIISFKVGFLSISGSIGACLLGTVVFGLGGFSWALVLMGFFIPSSILSKLFKNKKKKLDEKFSKGSKRDIWQVWANGGVAGLFVIAHAFFPSQIWPWLAFCGSIAAVNADTWATELGVLSKKPPIHIISGKAIERGSSGAVSLLGTLAALMAALLIAIPGVLLLPVEFPDSTSSQWILFGTITIAGLFGSFVDSLLGATFQVIYYCSVCDKETEKYPLHICGSKTKYYRGWKWLNNDWVNTFCALTGGLVMIIFFII